jgi:LCP family protein required for cell wall assembly
VTRRTKILIVLAGVVGAVVLIAGWQGVRAYMAWNAIERVPFDLEEARSDLTTSTAVNDASATTTSTTVPEPDPVQYTSVLVIGSDERPDEQRDGIFADAILLYLLPDDGSGPAVVSFPRDMVIHDPCTGERSKINRTLEPCSEAISGPEHAALAMEFHTSIPVDHFALIRFDAFADVVDEVDGVEVCVDYALREGGYDIMPAGCSTVDGEHALAWIRSRATQEFVDDEWVFATELGDAARVSRHQVLLFALLDKLKGMRSPADLAGIAENLGDSIVLSETFGIGDAVALAWDLRSQPASSIRTITVPTEPYPLDDGSFAVRATATVRELLAGQ